MAASQPTQAIRTAAILILIAYTAALVTSTHVPTPPEVLVPPVSDKWLHVVAYTGLAFLLVFNLSLRRPLGWRPLVVVVGGLAAFAALDEVTQIPFHRTCEFLDWLADMIGTLAGVGLLLVAAALWKRWSASSE